MTAKEVTKDFAKTLFPKRVEESNKGTYGKVLNIAGSINYQGAAYLSSLAALKTGAGLVTLASTKQVVSSLAASCPWVTFVPLDTYNWQCIAHSAFEQVKNYLDSYSVVSIGPGLSTENETGQFVRAAVNYLAQTNKKSVIDADALNIIA